MTAREYLRQETKKFGFDALLGVDYDFDILIGKESGQQLSALLGVLQRRGFHGVCFTSDLVHIHAPLRNRVRWDHGWDAQLCPICDGTGKVVIGKKRTGETRWQTCHLCTGGWIPATQKEN